MRLYFMWQIYTYEFQNNVYFLCDIEEKRHANSPITFSSPKIKKKEKSKSNSAIPKKKNPKSEQTL